MVPTSFKRPKAPRKTTNETKNEYMCKYFQKLFVRKDNLARHENVHTGNRPYSSTYCNFRFTQKGDLKRHFATTHKDILDELPLKCKYCDYRSSQPYNLKVHVRNKHPKVGEENQEQSSIGADPNTGAEPVPATSARGPVDESRGHKKCTSEGSVDCYFSMVKNLNTNETDYECNWILEDATKCGKIFTKKDSVQRHIKSSHERNRPFVCDYGSI